VGGWVVQLEYFNSSSQERKKQTGTTKRNRSRKQRTKGNVPELKEGYIAAVHLGTVNSQDSHSPPASRYFAGRRRTTTRQQL
jgi:hypothetical protein